MTRGDATVIDKSVGDSPAQGGFTLIEILVALIVLIIGVAGVLSMQMSAMKGTSYSRHATEAIVLAEDKLEDLLTMNPQNAAFLGGNDRVNAQGVPVAIPTFGYDRTWTIGGGSTPIITLQIVWQERNRDPHTLTFRTQRSLF